MRIKTVKGGHYAKTMDDQPISQLNLFNQAGNPQRKMCKCLIFGKGQTHWSSGDRLLGFLIPRPLAAGFPLKIGPRACPGV